MTAVEAPSGTRRIQMWVLAPIVHALVAIVPAVLTADGGGLLPHRAGPPVEALAVERTTLHPGSIELTIRNTGPDPVQVVQVSVNDTYVDFGSGTHPVNRLRSERLTLSYPWITGQPYTVSILTSTGLVIEYTILAGEAFGGPRLVVLGAGLAFLALTALDRLLDRRRQGQENSTGGLRLALMVAIGIGLHNAGEGLAIGSAYAIGELAVGTALVVGFALHNTTEGLAIVAPLTSQRPSAGSLIALGAVAGAPVIPGAVIGVVVDNAALSAALLGVGVGAILQVIVQISRALRSREGRLLEPTVVAGLGVGVAVMYLTGLLVPA